jgi:hypothetical protein
LVNAVTCEVSVPIIPSRKSAAGTLRPHKSNAQSLYSTLFLISSDFQFPRATVIAMQIFFRVLLQNRLVPIVPVDQ